MRVFAIDHGIARAGYAVCDPTETVVRPLGTIEPPDPVGLRSLAEDSGAELIVVGVPVSLDGQEGEQARIAREFADRLAEVVDVPVEIYDERLTTRMAEGSAREGATAPPDALAAAHLLEGYLASRKAAR
jgi:putative Holliday junction resolvase